MLLSTSGGIAETEVEKVMIPKFKEEKQTLWLGALFLPIHNQE